MLWAYAGTVVETSSPRSSPLALPALSLGVCALAIIVIVRVPIGSYLVTPLAVFSVVTGHAAAAKSRGRARWMAAAGSVAGYLALASVAAWFMAIEMK